MRIRGGGGGGGSASLPISVAHSYNGDLQTIAAGVFAIITLDQFTKNPPATTDYSYIADAGEGGPGIRVNKQGLYTVMGMVGVSTDTAGIVQCFFDYPPYNGVMPFGFGNQHIEHINEQMTINFSAVYYTVAGQTPDAITIGVRNSTAGIVSTAGGSVALAIARIGDSPS